MSFTWSFLFELILVYLMLFGFFMGEGGLITS